MYFRVCPHCGCALDPNEGKWNVEEVETEE